MTASVVARLDPALRRFAAARTDLSAETLPAVRQSLDGRRAEAAPTVDTSGVEIDDRTARFGHTSIAVRIYRGGTSPAPAVVYCHSGAFVLGNLDTDHRQCVEFARRAECTVISVDYRLAPEHRYPAAVDDALTGLRWVVANADEIQVDSSRIAVAGSSAGGALAALLAQASTAGAAPPVVFQLLHQPVLDDRPTPSKREFATTPGFDGPAVEQMWRHYLPAGTEPAGTAPARSADLTALPPDWEISRQLFDLQGTALRRALHY